MSDGESDDGKRASKKRKASRACDRCNSQHQPCDNASPKCSVCERAGTECTYNRPVRKRGPRSGYTGQNGERLWSIVLQARPELEDLVLQILRSSTYGNSGVSNYDYFRNTENQTELVSRFNESRLGRYLQHGESPDLMLPPIDEQVPMGSLQLHHDLTPKSQSSNPAIQVDVPGPAANATGSMLPSLSPSNSGIVNPHGAPQNPGDIYVQAEEIRKRAPPMDSTRSHGHIGESPQAAYGRLAFQPSPAAPPIAPSAPFGRDFANGYNNILHQQTQDNNGNSTTVNRSNSKTSGDSSPQQQKSDRSVSRSLDQRGFDADANDNFHWFDSTPTDTLLNLGFVPGDGMAQDFLDLCENPEPIEPTPAGSIHQDEDEEAVWRRLVMRGRFI